MTVDRDRASDRDAEFERSVVTPLVDLILGSGARIVGISGAAGAGKTTLAIRIQERLAEAGREAICLSLDDFCYSTPERERRGIPWRATPGSHDMALLEECLEKLSLGAAPLELPAYDKLIDDRIEPIMLERAPDVVLFDGWFVGCANEPYGAMWRYLDLHVHLAVPLSLAKRRRFGREEKLRKSGGGLSLEEMTRFWDEVLGPIAADHVVTAEARARIVLEVTEAGEALRYRLVDRGAPA